MNYLNTIAIKTGALCCLLLLSGSSMIAQNTTDSPYSRYGIGLIQPAKFNSNIGSGGIGYAWRPSIYKPQVYDSLSRSNVNLNDRRTNFINLKNPASFSNISLTTFEMGVLSKNVNYLSLGQSRVANNTTISHVALAFPIGQFVGMGFGLRPYSAVGYSYENRSNSGGTISTNTYEGSGGLNELFVGAGAEVTKRLSLGFTGKYLFGKIEDDKRVIFTDAFFFNTLDRTETDISDFSFDLGMQYITELSSDYRMVLGLTASPIDEVNAKETNLLATYSGGVFQERIKDTINFSRDLKRTVPIASSYGGGVSFEKLGKWAVELDYTQRIWTNSNQLGDNAELVNAMIVNFGFEKFNEISSFGSYFKRMGYRLGFNYNSSLVRIDGTDIDEMAVSAGFSLPLRKSFSTLNFGIELGKRGTQAKGLTEEEFLNVLVGVTIKDKWLIKRKYDKNKSNEKTNNHST